jgi:hypothetical protein
VGCSLFQRRGDLFLPGELTRSPWSEDTQHAGPVSALVARAVEALEPLDLALVRLTIDILRPLPVLPLTVQASVARAGRRVQLAAASVRLETGEELVRASCWRVRRASPLSLGTPPDMLPPSPPSPESLPPFDFAFRTYTDFFGHAVDKRLAAGDVAGPGRATVWFRLRVPVVEDEPITPLQTVMAVVDSANGISWMADPASFVFPNTDVGVYLARDPVGEWIALDSVSYLDPTGRGISDTALFDSAGFLGRANQVLYLGRR